MPIDIPNSANDFVRKCLVVRIYIYFYFIINFIIKFEKSLRTYTVLIISKPDADTFPNYLSALGIMMN